MDVQMMVVLTGKERTETEFGVLLKQRWLAARAHGANISLRFRRLRRPMRSA